MDHIRLSGTQVTNNLKKREELSQAGRGIRRLWTERLCEQTCRCCCHANRPKCLKTDLALLNAVLPLVVKSPRKDAIGVPRLGLSQLVVVEGIVADCVWVLKGKKENTKSSVLCSPLCSPLFIRRENRGSKNQEIGNDWVVLYFVEALGNQSVNWPLPAHAPPSQLIVAAPQCQGCLCQRLTSFLLPCSGWRTAQVIILPVSSREADPGPVCLRRAAESSGLPPRRCLSSKLPPLEAGSRWWLRVTSSV
ncbi:uncharacterized protein [Nothobranchius furzeri]|uniref:uncharacterized protein n=1 Tax=Nothobranchius furzeri TaxID=105023 RepID=UPI003904CE0F